MALVNSILDLLFLTSNLPSNNSCSSNLANMDKNCKVGTLCDKYTSETVKCKNEEFNNMLLGFYSIVNENNTKLQKAIENLSQNYINLNSKVENNGQQITALSVKGAELSTSLGDINNQLNTLKSDVLAMKDQLSAVDGKFAPLKTSISTLESNLNALAAAFYSAKNELIPALTRRIDDLQALANTQAQCCQDRKDEQRDFAAKLLALENRLKKLEETPAQPDPQTGNSFSIGDTIYQFDLTEQDNEAHSDKCCDNEWYPAIFETPEKFNAVVAYIKGRPDLQNKLFYVHGEYVSGSGSSTIYNWKSNSPINANFWDEGEPDINDTKKCLAFCTETYKLQTLNCTFKLLGICQNKSYDFSG